MQKRVIFYIFDENWGQLNVAEEVRLFFHEIHKFSMSQIFYFTISNTKR